MFIIVVYACKNARAIKKANKLLIVSLARQTYETYNLPTLCSIANKGARSDGRGGGGGAPPLDRRYDIMLFVHNTISVTIKYTGKN